MEKRIQKHPFHMVTPSPWPFYTSLAALMVAVGLVQYMHFFSGSLFFLLFSVFYLVGVLALWWRDVVREATYEGMHTLAVQRGLKIGFILFIVSEIFFFVAFFWAYFHSSLAPGIEIGSVWPPFGIPVLDPFSVPLLNTFILLCSGLTVTYAHHALISRNTFFLLDGLIFTLFLAILFLFFQFLEYSTAAFSIADGIYGSTFFMATGFHGFHVMIGTIFLYVCGMRAKANHFTSDHHVGLEAAAWYWHFVDVVWLFLFISIYWWGSLG
jgi:cytochrome c oxidase subunit 3